MEEMNKQLFLKEWEKKQEKAGGLAKGGWTISRLLGHVRIYSYHFITQGHVLTQPLSDATTAKRTTFVA